MAELNITNIPAPRVPFIDERTGLMAREWYRFFLNLFVSTGSGGNPTTLDDLQIGPPNQPDLTELLTQINQNIAPQYKDQSGDFLATLDTAQLMSMMARFENLEAAIQGAYLNPPQIPSSGGDVVGPSSSTDNAVARFDGTTGKLIQNSVTTIDDTGNASGILSQQFSDGTAVTLAAGKLWYNGTTGSWNGGMGNGNITQQIGEEIFIYGKASAAITDSPLQIIYKTGVVGASGVVAFAPTIAGITEADQILGIATESLAHNDFGRITTFGIVRAITTNGTAFGEVWADNDDIYYNPVTGNPTKTKPVAPNIKVQLGTIINAGSGGSGSFFVNIGSSSVLGGTDANVQFGALANNNLIAYDSAVGYWKNVTASSIGLGTVTSVSVVSANGLAGTVATATTTPAITLSTTITGLLKGNGTAISAAASGTDYAPATSGTSILYGNGSGGFSNVTIGTGVSFAAGTLSATGSGGSVTSVSFTGGIITVATATSTPALTVAGTSGGIPYFSSASTWATSAALAAGSLVQGGGAGVAPSTITTGTGVVTALGVNTGSAGAFVTFNGAGGTPSSMTATNLTGTASGLTAGTASAVAVGGITGLGTGVATALAVNVGSAGSPVVNGGALGTPSSGTVTNLTGTGSININGTVGATTANTGAFTTITATSIKFGSGAVLSSYEEGTWTPTGNGVSLTVGVARYVKVGNLVTVAFDVTWPATANGSAANIGGLPFNPVTAGGVAIGYMTASLELHFNAGSGAASLNVYLNNGSSPTNLQLSSSRIIASCSYLTT